MQSYYSSDTSLSPYTRINTFIPTVLSSSDHHHTINDTFQLYSKTPIPDDIVHGIEGNAPRYVKETPMKLLALFRMVEGRFGDVVGHRIRVTRVDIEVEDGGEDGERKAVVISELDVQEDMVNHYGVLMGGCSAWLIDEGSTIAYFAIKSYIEEECPWLYQAIASQYIEVFFHSPAPLGAKLRVINTSKTRGGEDRVCRTEIWDATNHRLVASGNQIKTHNEGFITPEAKL